MLSRIERRVKDVAGFTPSFGCRRKPRLQVQVGIEMRLSVPANIAASLGGKMQSHCSTHQLYHYFDVGLLRMF